MEVAAPANRAPILLRFDSPCHTSLTPGAVKGSLANGFRVPGATRFMAFGSRGQLVCQQRCSSFRFIASS